jgi:RNA polymerase sigma-70 factor (ECF subfamily)
MRTDRASRKVTPLSAHKRVPTPSNVIAEDAFFWGEEMRSVAACGDVEAFLRIYDHFAPRLKRYLLCHGVAAPQADDLVQEAMMRVWRHAARFDAGRASLSTWLFRIVRNLQIDAHRREAHRQVEDELPEGDSAGIADEDAVLPDDYADHAGLDRAIHDLPADQARLIRMAYLEARSHSEIAAELGMPLGSVKSTLRRAFARLRTAMGAMP